MPTLSTDVQTAPNGTVSLYVDLTAGELRVHAAPDPDPEDWAWMQSFIAAAEGGEPIRSREEYEQGADVFVVKIQPDVLATLS
jgi:hypothetical protein